MSRTDLYQMAAGKIGCQKTDIANLNLYPGGRLVVKMKFGKVYDFQATPKTGAALVLPGKPFHVGAASGIDLTETAAVEPTVGLVGSLIKVKPSGKPAFGGLTPGGGNDSARLPMDAASSLPRTRLVKVPMVSKNQVIKAMARTLSAVESQAPIELSTPPAVHGQTGEMTSQVSPPKQAVAAVKTRRRGTPHTPEPVTPTENPPV